jgi:hypothetical protein
VIELAPGFIYSLFKDLLALALPKRRKLTPAQTVETRKKWKAEIEPYIVEKW